MKEIELMGIALPEDVLKAKWCGDFPRAERLIARRLEDEKTPACLKARLRLEREILKKLPLDYTFTAEAAVALVRRDIPDFTEEELDTLRDCGKVDWIYIGGETMYSRRFYETLLAVQPDIAARAGRPKKTDTEEYRLLEQNIADMKQNGGAAWRFRLRATFKIADTAFQKGAPVLVHLPVPKAAENSRDIEILAASHPYTASPEDAAARTVAISGAFEQNEPFWVEYAYTADVRYTAPDAKDVSPVQPHFDTEEIPPHVRFTPYIRALERELSAGETNPLIRARRFYDFCTTQGTYSYMREYFALPDTIPDYFAAGLKGDCGVQAITFITLCRCAGIPARWQSGLFVTPYDVGCHDWAQFYIAPYGWLFADCSFGGSAHRMGNAARHDFYFGNLDPFRMVANSAWQAALSPEKQQLRIDPFDNQRGEAEYPDRGVIWTEAEATWEVKSAEKLQ